ncbi:MAG TPA: hypothetical protein VI749_06670 [Candidatus Omnitrophota bacterium]|nr:hypothetical protein [Candidatus Omnitrophota bacterium]
MTKNQRFIWEVYFLVILLFMARKIFDFFTPDTPAYLYFHILQCFDPLFLFVYFFNVAQIVLNTVLLIPLALFIYQLKIGPPVVWRVLFILKMVFDTIGHSYETTYLVSLFYHSRPIAIMTFLSSVAVYIPAFIAQFSYAFRQEKLNLKDI